ncbi:polysaccharide pyruvyl transferase family protein [Chelativorans xinjiangense]|uniref:polysaccharide pyruvyl transferase family protein n=1 Tax=Chelativorans xinjiangense TaxID=2681485 RepID=UPI00135740E8|nr:polysaccharide pyruvyl transferase family protein [Chelativorans xinjiangense]
MKLTYFQCKIPNFGDDLNAYIWPRLLEEGFFDDDERELFVGIGSIIYDDYPRQAHKIVVGSGYGGYTDPPDVHDGFWEFAFVRGPRSADILKIPRDRVITDGAVLLRAVELPPPAPETPVIFIPHFQSLDRGNWKETCALAGIRFVDPSSDVETVLSEIQGARLVITESMHGAIVADAMRTPWVAVTPIAKVHRFKWTDWAESLDVPLRAHKLFPSTTREAWSALSGGQGTGRRSRSLDRSAVARPFNLALKHAAARGLQRLAEQEPQLSADTTIARATERAVAAVEAIRLRHLKARKAAQTVSR